MVVFIPNKLLKSIGIFSPPSTITFGAYYVFGFGMFAKKMLYSIASYGLF